ncbi:MAG TPA: STAS domain-containing protein [Candidatus Dormibacteraeota bacterium]|nr:STAS domain-containing protein [Candidatus Dormibacteraeota bacterium]
MERVPIVKIGKYLLATIQTDVQDNVALALQEDLGAKIVASRASLVLVDISSLQIVDSFIGRMIGDISGMARLLDAEVIVVGMQPAVAMTLVELGLTLTGVRTALNVEAALAMAGIRDHT